MKQLKRKRENYWNCLNGRTSTLVLIVILCLIILVIYAAGMLIPQEAIATDFAINDALKSSYLICPNGVKLQYNVDCEAALLLLVLALQGLSSVLPQFQQTTL